jgi:hypothetical protein
MDGPVKSYAEGWHSYRQGDYNEAAVRVAQALGVVKPTYQIRSSLQALYEGQLAPTFEDAVASQAKKNERRDSSNGTSHKI